MVESESADDDEDARLWKLDEEDTRLQSRMSENESWWTSECNSASASHSSSSKSSVYSGTGVCCGKARTQYGEGRVRLDEGNSKPVTGESVRRISMVAVAGREVGDNF